MNKKRVLKLAVFLVILGICVFGLTGALSLKWKYPCYETVVAKEFYDLDKDSVEVCVLGSSQVVYGISGMELYEDYGISAYSLGTALQPISASFSWLKEARKTQDIKLVVFDVSMLYETSDEARYRQAYDNMRMSPGKLQALYEHCSTSETADPLLSYIFKIVKYHDRWEELTEDDFTLTSQDTPIFRGNYAYALSQPVSLDAIAYDKDDPDDSLEMVEDQFYWFEQMVSYCKEEGLDLLLIKTPKANWNITKHQQLEAYAEEHDLPFLDFSSLDMINKLGLDTATDFRDNDHLNVQGANKLSKWLGNYITENYDLTDFRAVSGYDDMDYSRYAERIEDSKLQLCTDPVLYFDYLDDDRYEVLVQLTASASGFMTEELAGALKAAGLQSDLTQAGSWRYIAWLKGGESQYESLSEENFEFADKFGDGIGFRLFSTIGSDSDARMRVNYENQTFSQKGLNVMVYDAENSTVVDKSTIFYDPVSGGLAMTKDNNSYTER